MGDLKQLEDQIREDVYNLLISEGEKLSKLKQDSPDEYDKLRKDLYNRKLMIAIEDIVRSGLTIEIEEK